MRSHTGSIDTTHTPPPLSFYNTFKQMVENRLENTVVQYVENYKILQYNEELWHNTIPKMFLRVKIVTLLFLTHICRAGHKRV
jgi:hypothetical protein